MAVEAAVAAKLAEAAGKVGSEWLGNASNLGLSWTDKVGFDLDTTGRERFARQLMDEIRIKVGVDGKYNFAIWNMHVPVDYHFNSLVQTGLVPMGKGGGFRVSVFAADGYLINNGERGFGNWICLGGEQQDNRINFPSRVQQNNTIEQRSGLPSSVRSGEQVRELWSTDGRFRFVMQDDGNVVLYKGRHSKWASNTDGESQRGWPFRLTMQEDGNLVAYTAHGHPFWSSNTYDQPHTGPFRLIMQNDGNCVIYNAANRPTWATNTWES